MESESLQSPESNPAVFRCCEAWREAFQFALDNRDEEDEDPDMAAVDAGAAYREALPPLDGIRNLRDFIACITHGCMIGAIDGSDYSRLLYAVQVMNATRRVHKTKAKTSEKKSRSEAAKGSENVDSATSPASVQSA